jgi:hypothetical protein
MGPGFPYGAFPFKALPITAHTHPDGNARAHCETLLRQGHQEHIPTPVVPEAAPLIKLFAKR